MSYLANTLSGRPRKPSTSAPKPQGSKPPEPKKYTGELFKPIAPSRKAQEFSSAVKRLDAYEKSKQSIAKVETSPKPNQGQAVMKTLGMSMKRTLKNK